MGAGEEPEGGDAADSAGVHSDAGDGSDVGGSRDGDGRGAAPPVRKSIEKSAGSQASKAKSSGAAARPAGKAAAKPAASKPASAKAPTAKAGAKAAVKVKLPKAVIDKVHALNASGMLEQELRLGAIGVRLSEISQVDALEVLDGVAEDPSGRKDPITWVREAAKAIAQEARAERVANEGMVACSRDAAEARQVGADVPEDLVEDMPPANLDDFDDLAEAELAALGAGPRLPDEVDKRTRDMRSQGTLAVQTEVGDMRALLAILGELPAMEILGDLESSSAKTEREQTDFLIAAVDKLITGMQGTGFANRLSRRIRWMNANLNFEAPMHVGRSAAALASLGEVAALLVLKRMTRDVSEGTKFEKPTDWVVDVARRVRLGTTSSFARGDAVGVLAPAG